MLLEIMENMKFLHENYLEVGILGDGGSVDGKQEVTILEYGIINEFGSQSVKNRPPARAFMRNAIFSNEEKISDYIKELINSILRGELTGREAMIKLGLYLQGLISISIVTASNWAVDNAESTKKYKGKVSPNRNKPLIMEGYLYKSIRFKIVSEGGSLVHISDWSKIGG